MSETVSESAACGTSAVSSNRGIPCMWMRGGTSKGGYFLGSDLPDEINTRDALLLRVMGSPDQYQIDGMGGASPLTSKVAVISRSSEEGIDVEYLFLQIFVEVATVSDAQTCGNILAGVGPFAIERGLVVPAGKITVVNIRNLNTGQIVRAGVPTENGRPIYSGATHIDGVPGSASPIPLIFTGIAGSKCGTLLPTGNAVDRVEGLDVTLIDNGMPSVLIDASDLNVRGDEDPSNLEADKFLRDRLETLRAACGPLMNLGDVSQESVPKMVLLSASRAGGAISTRSFIPHSCHKSIGVLGAVSVATGCLLPEGPAARLAKTPCGREVTLRIEHPSGSMEVVLRRDSEGAVTEAGVMRTARKLFDGNVFI